MVKAAQIRALHPLRADGRLGALLPNRTPIISLPRPQEAESLYRTMVKRFRQQKGSWLSYGGFLLQQGQSDAASALLQRALQSLPSTDSEAHALSILSSLCCVRGTG